MQASHCQCSPNTSDDSDTIEHRPNLRYATEQRPNLRYVVRMLVSDYNIAMHLY